jgi:hypothetical protein
MSYVLASTTIKSPQSLDETNSTMVAQHRTLDGTVTRDYFGTNKRVWSLSYRNTKKADYDTINTIYQAYLLDEVPKSWSVTETNYTISATTVHIDLLVRSFSVRGDSYISDFDLILTEA